MRRCPLWLVLRRTSTLAPRSKSKLGNGPDLTTEAAVADAAGGPSRDAVRVRIIGAPTTGFLDLDDDWRS